jgi:thiol-disulfide isomerase/thioredoxin
VGGEKSKIFITGEEHNQESKIKFTYTKNVLCVTDSIKNPLFRDVMRSRQKSSELMTELYTKNGGKIEKSDSLKSLRKQYLQDLNLQTMTYLKDHSTEYFSFWYFWYQVVTPSSSMGYDTFYLRSLVNYFHSTFPKKYQQSYEGNYMMQMLEGAIKPPDINCDSPKFIKTDIFGKKIEIDKLKGKYVLLDFWASWCMPCLASVPVLKTLSNKYSVDSVVIIGISIDEDKQTMKSSIKENEMNWVHIWDYDNDLSNQFGVFSIPTFILIDKQGRIVFRGYGLEDKEKVVKYLDEKLNHVQ